MQEQWYLAQPVSEADGDLQACDWSTLANTRLWLVQTDSARQLAVSQASGARVSRGSARGCERLRGRDHSFPAWANTDIITEVTAALLSINNATVYIQEILIIAVKTWQMPDKLSWAWATLGIFWQDLCSQCFEVLSSEQWQWSLKWGNGLSSERPPSWSERGLNIEISVSNPTKSFKQNK